MAKKNGFACPFVLRRRRQLRPLSRIKGVRNRYIINIYAWAQKKADTKMLGGHPPSSK
jgi:hypothetical protein